MRLTVLGCSGSGPGPTAPASGYLITAGDTRVLLDLGNGSFGVLQRHIDPWLLDAVVLSHLHADHCADMANLVVHRRYHPLRPAAVAPLPVFGPADTATRLALAYAASSSHGSRWRCRTPKLPLPRSSSSRVSPAMIR